MQQPWRMEPDEVVYVDPWPAGAWPVARGDWATAEALVGTVLPSDYKELVGASDGAQLADELFVRSPFHQGRGNLLPSTSRSSWALAFLRPHDPSIGAIYPEPGGLLGWGSDGGGGEYYWDTSTGDPDTWTVCVGGRPVDSILRYPIGLVSYLEWLGDGLIQAAALDGWPPRGSRPVRIEP